MNTEQMTKEIERLREENRVLDERLAQSEFAMHGFRREALRRLDTYDMGGPVHYEVIA